MMKMNMLKDRAQGTPEVNVLSREKKSFLTMLDDHATGSSANVIPFCASVQDAFPPRSLSALPFTISPVRPQSPSTYSPMLGIQ